MTYIAHPLNKEQEKAVKAFLDALEVPYEVESNKDETAYLLSTEANKTRLQQAMEEDRQGKGTKLNLDNFSDDKKLTRITMLLSEKSLSEGWDTEEDEKWNKFL